jgi:hypothetical protein
MKDDAREMRFTNVDKSLAIDAEGNITIAVLKLKMTDDGFLVGFFWMPEFFKAEMPDDIRAALLESLRLHADKLESRDLDSVMRGMSGINLPRNEA